MELYGVDESAVQEARRGEVTQQESAAESELTRFGHTKVFVIDGRGELVSQAHVLLGADDGTYHHGLTGDGGHVILPNPRSGRLTVLCARDGFRGYVRHEVDTHGQLLVQLNNGNDSRTGSILNLNGTGYIPGLSGRLNPIHDSSGRYFLYADNVAIEHGRIQPVQFELGEPLTVQDANGEQFELRIVEMLGRTALVEYTMLNP